MGEAELEALGLRRVAQDAGDLRMPEVPEHLRHLELQPASEELLESMAGKGWKIKVVEKGTEEFQYLKQVEASGSYLHCLDGRHEITLPKNASKIAAIEEFLHGTQSKIGLLDDLPREIAEIHVKDFMLKHANLLGLTENDITVLRELKTMEIEKARLRGYTWREAE